jgi:hypothetical protein
MRKMLLSFTVIVLVITSLITGLSSCKKKCKDCIVITPKIQYTVPILNKDPDQGWWVKNIEGPEREKFMKKLYAGIASGKLKTYDYKTWNEESVENALMILKGKSDIETNLNHINKLSFLEKWIINKNTAEISKKVIAVCPIMLKDSNETPLFWIKFDTIKQENASIKSSNLISKRIQYDVTINNMSKTEWWIDNIESSKRSRLINILFNTAYSGKSMLYDYFNEPINADILKKELNPVDTFKIPTADHSGDTTIITRRIVDSAAFKKLRFMEEWYLDDQTYNFTKKVKGINLLEEKVNMQGEFLGNSPLFWIYFDKRYPVKATNK